MLVFRVVMVVACCVLRAAAPEDDSAAYTASCATARGSLLVPVFINQAGPHECVLDAAIQSPVVHKEIAAYLGLPYVGAAAGEADGAAPGGVVRVEGLRFAGMPAHETEVGVLDLGPLSARLGTRVAGLLPAYQPGLEVTIDFGTATVAWRPLGTAGLGGDGRADIPIKLDARGAPTAVFTINGEHSLALQIDTVHTGLVALPEGFLKERGILQEATQRLVTPLDGKRRQTQIRLAELALDDSVVKSPVCTILPEDEAGRVGLGFLRHFRVTLGFEYGLMRLERASSEPLTDPPVVGCGLIPRRFSSGYWDVCVAEGTPAYRAGLRTGDVLGSVNAESLRDLGFEAVVNRLSGEAGAVIAVTVARSNAQAPSGYDYREVSLTIEPLL